MRTKSIALILALALALALGGRAEAGIDFSAAFTGDNYIDSFMLTGGGKTVSLGAKQTGWRESMSVSGIQLNPGTAYTATWVVRNVPLTNEQFSAPAVKTDDGSQNPMAFLGQITVGGVTYLSSSGSIWKILGEDPVPSSAKDPVQFSANNPAQLPGSDYQIWYNVKGSPVSGISGQAAWIGSGTRGQDGDGMLTVTAQFTTKATPIPGAAWLLGSGLAVLAGFRRKLS